MGVIKHFSSSSHDNERDKSVSMFSHWKDDEKKIRVVTETKYESLPNPRPDNYKILRDWKKKQYLVIEIQYLDCINYEGKKVLVFENCTLDDLKKQKLIDPHFSENEKFISPIARFEPTDRGWQMAQSFVHSLF